MPRLVNQAAIAQTSRDEEVSERGVRGPIASNSGAAARAERVRSARRTTSNASPSPTQLESETESQESESETQSGAELESQSESEQAEGDFPAEKSRAVEFQFYDRRHKGVDVAVKFAVSLKQKTAAVGGVRSKVGNTVKLSASQKDGLLSKLVSKSVLASLSLDSGLAVEGWVTSQISFEFFGLDTNLADVFNDTKLSLIKAGFTAKSDGLVKIGSAEGEIAASVTLSLPPETVAKIAADRGPRAMELMLDQVEKIGDIERKIGEAEELIKEQKRIAARAEEVASGLYDLSKAPRGGFPLLAEKLGPIVGPAAKAKLAELEILRESLAKTFAHTQEKLARLGEIYKRSQVGGKLRKLLTGRLGTIARGSATVLKGLSKVAAWPLLLIDALDAVYLLDAWVDGHAVIWPFESRLPGSDEGDNLILPNFTNQNIVGKRVDGTERFSDASPALTRLFTRMTGPSSESGGTAVDAEWLKRFFAINEKYPITDEKAAALEGLIGKEKGDSLDALEKLAQLSTEEIKALAPKDGEVGVSTAALDVAQLKELAAKRAGKQPEKPSDSKKEADPDDLARFTEDQQVIIKKARALFVNGMNLSPQEKIRFQDLLAQKMTREKLALFEKYPSLRQFPLDVQTAFWRLDEVLAMSPEKIEELAKKGGVVAENKGATSEDENGDKVDGGGVTRPSVRLENPANEETTNLGDSKATVPKQKSGETSGLGANEKSETKNTGEGKGAGEKKTGEGETKTGEGDRKSGGTGDGKTKSGGGSEMIIETADEPPSGETTTVYFRLPKGVDAQNADVGGWIYVIARVPAFPKPNTKKLRGTVVDKKIDGKTTTLTIRLDITEDIYLKPSADGPGVFIRAGDLLPLKQIVN